jgi:hypothetical protein
MINKDNTLEKENNGITQMNEALIALLAIICDKHRLFRMGSSLKLTQKFISHV